MITAIDTNVLVALWDRSDALNSAAQAALDSAQDSGKLVISGVVFAELLGFPRRTELFIEKFLIDTGISVEWLLSESTWRATGRAFQAYSMRRRRHGLSGARRLIADFVIGAHAAQKGYRLLTLDERTYRVAFPKLVIVAI